MTIRSLGDKVPRIAPTAWVSEAAYVVGDVVLGELTSVWPGAVVRGDYGSIVVGENTAIEDGCILHTGEPLVIGDDDIIGHRVVVHCASVGSRCLIGNGAVLLDGAVIGDVCLVAAGSLVLGGTVIPDGSFVAGSPATVTPLSDRHRQRLEGQGRRDSEWSYAAMAHRYRDAGW